MNNSCVLKLYKLFFQKIEFNRIGGKNENAPKFTLQTAVMEYPEEKLYRVEVTLTGDKKDEYVATIVIAGVFSVSEDENLNEIVRKRLITTNAVAILIPYLRSEMSLLTAQPETESVVLPPLNIAALMEEKKENQ